MDNKYRGIDEIIRQAMDQGAFENLRGKGEPLNLDENSFVDNEWKLAYHLLKQNGFAPDFVEKRQTIEMQLADARQALTRIWSWRTSALNDGQDKDWIESEWGKAIATFEGQITQINVSIKTYNLSIPMPSLYKKPVVLEDELALFKN